MRALWVLPLVCCGCIALVSPTAGGEHCRFRGEDSSCGRCLTSRCRSEIDDACFDEAVIGAIESCAENGDGSCKNLPSCGASRCAAYCFERVGTSVVNCSESFLAPGLVCRCVSSGEAPNDVRCSTDLYPRTRCCAQAGWPRPALECDCRAAACFPAATGCVCLLADNLGTDTAQDCVAPPGGHCCAFEDQCRCTNVPCQGSFREVAACNKQEMRCPAGRVEVAECSTRR